ncbi:hypothetical protein AMTRI_Chr02g217110 [Amborella trichopoda]
MRGLDEGRKTRRKGIKRKATKRRERGRQGRNETKRRRCGEMGFRERKWEVAGGGGRCSESAREGREARLEESREVEAKMAAVLPPGSGGLREDNRRRGWVGWSREEKGAVAEAGRR